ncbi:Microtubule-nucleating Tub4p (gamma-tubulin) complex component [Cladophialophora chaetospira]|uniref:Microtubule-nucleating Tub4p (Gamma-tubulin) complex component n=1 Tax=Cladophialophora chaetospira TaxID=386627 RepID=A0AA39CKV1_9EURO|nr:Microtubule-nucleating Tub4p (gamma-tubulin) complex component [Cladophialophora chaetospira]
MADPRLHRVEGTLTSLLESLVPPGADLDDTDAEFRIDRAIQNAKDHVLSADSRLPTDTNQAQDLIKRKLLRENASPEKAARFANLYSRLLAIPVLNQKWAILYLLYKLSDDDLPESRPRNPLADSDQLANIPRRQTLSPRKPYVADEDEEEDANGVENVLPPQPASLHRGRTIPPQSNQPDEELEMPRGQKEEPLHKDANLDHSSPSPPKREPRVVSPSEAELLRDLPFNLQGVSSAHLDFMDTTSLKLPSTLPIPILSLLHALAEPCLLYRGLAEYCARQDGGLMDQSLRSAINNELRSYLSLVASLETEIRQALATVHNNQDQKAVRMTGVTLKKCLIWTRDATMGLRLMKLIVEDSKQKRGGQLLSLIHSLSSSHGDPFVSSFAEKILAQVARPFYEMLKHWIYDGELIDPYHEFFVTEPDPNSLPPIDHRHVATSVWEEKYKLDTAMLPSIISSELSRKVFLIGKSLNFIRHNCGDSDWVIQYSKSNSRSLDYGNTSNLSQSIDVAYRTTMSRLTHLMSTKFGLFTHLTAIKKYMLLAQGDFFDLLIESLAQHLDRPVNSMYRHNLTSQLEHAIRHSNAQYDDAEVLRRLDARMLELSSGEIGWDCFTLEYKISAPCDVVITQWANTQYLKIFNLLWRIKRIEYSLASTCKRSMTGGRGVLAAVSDKLGNDWKRSRCVVAEMVHFVNQLQYYLLFEVIEASWKKLEDALQKPEATLDDLIEAHTTYLNNITKKGLIGQQRHPVTGQQEDSLLVQVHHILKCMLAYREVIDSLYSYSVAEYTRRQQFNAKIERRTAQGKWGITEKDLQGDSRASTPTGGAGLKGTQLLPEENDSSLSPPNIHLGTTDDETHLTSLRSRQLNLSAEFRSRVSMLLYDLAHQPDVDLRFLGVVMNFNEVYQPVNVRRQQARRVREKRELERKARDATFSSEGNVSVEKDVNSATVKT